MATFARFETNPQPVEARRLFVSEPHEISGRMVMCPPGMWLVRAKGTNALMLMPDDIFRLGMRPTDTRSEAIWKEETNQIHPQWRDGEEIPLS